MRVRKGNRATIRTAIATIAVAIFALAVCGRAGAQEDEPDVPSDSDNGIYVRVDSGQGGIDACVTASLDGVSVADTCTDDGSITFDVADGEFLCCYWVNLTGVKPPANSGGGTSHGGGSTTDSGAVVVSAGGLPDTGSGAPGSGVRSVGRMLLGLLVAWVALAMLNLVRSRPMFERPR